MVVNSVVLVIKFCVKCHFMEDILEISSPRTDLFRPDSKDGKFNIKYNFPPYHFSLTKFQRQNIKFPLTRTTFLSAKSIDQLHNLVWPNGLNLFIRSMNILFISVSRNNKNNAKENSQLCGRIVWHFLGSVCYFVAPCK